MEIHILRDGQQLGPFTEEATQALLKQGAVAIGDLACRPGDAEWLPLYAVLYPAAADTPTRSPSGLLPAPPVGLTKAPTNLAKTPAVQAPASQPVVGPPAVQVSIRAKARPTSDAMNDPATARQKAFLSYMGIAFSNDIDKGQAALLMNEAMENPKDPRRLQQWNVDRLRLHPDIFADEIKAKKDNRSHYFFETCQTEGAEFFEKVTKAHTQVLVGYLDVRFPNWDEREDDAKYSYFFPAIAEKFPQLLKKSARGKFKYPEGPKVAKELSRRSAVSAPPQSSPSATGAMFRGAFMGLIILGMLYWGWAAFMAPGGKLLAKTGTVTAVPSPAPAPPLIKPTPVRKDSLKTATNSKSAKALEPEKPKKEPLVAPEEKRASEVVDATPPPASESSTGANPAAVLLVSNPFEPLAPTAPIPVPIAAAPPPAPLPPAGRTSVKLTKPTAVVLKFGTSTLRPGTVLPIVSVDGATVKVRYGPDVVPIPAANTDINDEASSP